MKGRRILVVEDECLIAADMIEILSEFGYRVIGPATTLTEGIAMVEREGCDAALLDINLTGSTSRPLAELLKANGVPFAYVTGYGASVSKMGFPPAPVAIKPVDERELESLLRDLLP